MNNIKYYSFVFFLLVLKFSALLGQNHTDTSKVTLFFKEELVDKNYHYENVYFSIFVNASAYNIDSVEINLIFQNKAKKQCYINKNIQQLSPDEDTLPYFGNHPYIPSEECSRTNYRIKLLAFNEKFNYTIKIKKSINKINLNLSFFYKIEDVLSKIPNNTIFYNNAIKLEGYLGSDLDYEGIGRQEITISDFYISKSGTTSIFFSGID